MVTVLPCRCETGVWQERTAAVDQDGAGAALAEPAAEFRAGETEAPQHVKQRLVGIDPSPPCAQNPLTRRS